MRIKSNLILLITALIWGTAFVAQRVAAQQMGVFLFNSSRFLLAVVVLWPISRFNLQFSRKSWAWMFTAGALLFAGSGLQQAGLRWTTAGNAGFITGLYVVFIPIILLVVWKQRVSSITWVAVMLAVVGIKFLSSPGAFHLSFGDVLELFGAVMWALHVIIVGKAVRHMDILSFSIGQYLVCGLLNLAVGLMVDLPTFTGISGVWWAILYTGLGSTALGFTMQAIGQRHSPPTDAALILSLEAVFAALSGYCFLGEKLTTIQMGGCGLILVAILLVQTRGNEPAPEVEFDTV